MVKIINKGVNIHEKSDYFFHFRFPVFHVNTASFAGAEVRDPVDPSCLNAKVIDLKYPMQQLWVEHAWWTRSLIVSTLSDLKDKDVVLARLLKNQEDLGTIIKSYYGEEEGNKFTALLKEHILIAGKIIDAARRGDQPNINKFNKEWVQNADEIVAFLTSANPYWSKKVLTEMFYTHLKLTTDEVIDRLKGDWVGDVRTADTNETHLIHMGDILTEGIVKQFPEKFR
ncbi:glycosyltransferase [Bacillus salipaludis]|uniref:Glycosyltransferase n=1 Tax=Bacillus salipaludis TaxID=2547811 RepID=A0AA90R6G9_9BACI|nr:glycosyltransferase [Bacillus salipaludis]MDQ6598781.1 glycosyltransferase [Bacillus salipaludis]